MILALTLPQALGLSLIGAILLLFVGGMITSRRKEYPPITDGHHRMMAIERLKAQREAYRNWGFDEIGFFWPPRH